MGATTLVDNDLGLKLVTLRAYLFKSVRFLLCYFLSLFVSILSFLEDLKAAYVALIPLHYITIEYK